MTAIIATDEQTLRAGAERLTGLQASTLVIAAIIDVLARTMPMAEYVAFIDLGYEKFATERHRLASTPWARSKAAA